MTSSPVSSIEALSAAIQSYNLFDKPAIVTNQDVWDKGFPDVETLNAEASDAIFRAIEQVRSGQCKVTSIAMTAEPGVGKSHIISRIRHRLQAEGGALFVYARKYGNLNLIKYQFQQILADSLSQIGSQGVMQWQELAADMANKAWRAMNPNAQLFSAKQLVETFSNPNSAAAKNIDWVDKLAADFRRLKRVDPDIIRAILLTLSEDYAPHAIKWLSGKSLSEAKSNALELPNPDYEDSDKEAEAFETVCQLLNLISDYNTLIVCFDELDANEVDDAGLTRAQVIASLVKDLFDNINRGVIVTVMLPDTWKNKIKQFSNASGIPARVSAAQPNPIDLNYMDGSSIVKLVTLWLENFYKDKNLVPPTATYPFEKEELVELGRQKLTVRQILRWCADNFKPRIIVDPAPPIIEPIKPPVELAFNKELEEGLGEYLEDFSLLEKALKFGFRTLIHKNVEGVTIQDVTGVEPKRDNAGYINFKVLGTEKDKVVKIGVSILQYSHGKGVTAGLSRLVQYKKFGLTRGCLVRSKKINPRWNAQTHLDKLISELGGEWAMLKVEDVKPLIAIQSVYEARQDYGLSEEQIFDFIDVTGLTANNPLLKEILSDPSGQIPTDAVDE
ncbi:MAG: ATP-binding protein [Aphanothece sp. CMT-3BRIN-NPC111]|nr:ATP-binding protein [Aphanothece sp. CMT-3BRIN-NPC111]